MNESDLLEQKELLAENTIARIVPDICVGCNCFLTSKVTVLVRVPSVVSKYTYVAIDICQPCAELKDYNRLKKGLAYWLQEGKVEVLKNV